MEKEKGILYLVIHKKMEERVNMSRIYPKKDFFRMLGETFHVPKNMRIVVMKEMINKNLIEDLGTRRNNNLKVLKTDICIDKDVSKICQHVGMF